MTKILMVTMSLDIGGAETHIVELCNSLSQMDYDISIVSNGGSYEKELNKNVKIYHLPLNTRNIFSVLKSYFGLKKLIKANKYDIVHAHARIPAFLCGLLNKKLDFRFTTTAHLDFKVNPIYKKISNWGEKTIAVSSDIKEYLIQNYGINENNISLTINGINLDKFSKQEKSKKIIKEFNLSEAGTKIVSISRLDEDRSLVAKQLIDITPDLLKENDVDILIVGDGNDFDAVKEKADAINNAIGKEKVHLLGARTDISEILSVSDIFVGVSRAALEAMASEKPVILAGNQGYLGIFSKDNLKDAIDTNFCCRGAIESSTSLLLNDCLNLLKLEKNALDETSSYNRKIVEDYYSTDKMALDYKALFDSLPPYSTFKYPDIILSGYYGFDNQGDDTLLSIIYENIVSKYTNIKVAALTKGPKGHYEKTKIASINRLNIFSMWSKLRHSKILISGGGTLFQDSTSTKSLLYYLFIIKLAKLCKNKVFIYANGVGPLSLEKNKKRVVKVLNKVDKITLRTPKDKEYLESIGFLSKDKIEVSADPAYLLDVSNLSIKNVVYLNNDKKYFAISVRECANGSGHYDEKLFEDNLVSTIKSIMTKYDLVPIFIPMQSEYDLDISNRIRSRLNSGIVLENLSAKETCAIFEKMEFVIAMRLHALIFSSLVNTPMIGISYDPKVDDLLSYIGISKAVKIDDKLESSLSSSVEYIYSNYDEFKKNLTSRANSFKKLAANDIKEIENLL